MLNQTAMQTHEKAPLSVPVALSVPGNPETLSTEVRYLNEESQRNEHTSEGVQIGRVTCCDAETLSCRDACPRD